MSLSSSGNPPARFTDSWASVHFDLLRGLAATFVLAGHWRNLFFVDFPQILAHRTLLKVPYLLTGAGHQSVIFFFVLSGYFIGGTIFRSFEHNQWEWRGYLLRRIVRLWTVLVPALLLCLFWDRLGIRLGHAPALYAGNVPNHIVRNVPPLLAPHVFFGNLFFVQTILTPTFGSDGALWSLANEFWYYLLFPLGMVIFWRRASLLHRLMCAGLFAAIAWFVRGGILASFPTWLVGAVLFKLRPPDLGPQTAKLLRIAASILYPVIFFTMARLHEVPNLFSDYLLAVVTFLYLWIMLSARGRYAPEALQVRVSRELARFSYTLYTVHLPLLVFVLSLLAGESRWYPSQKTIPIALAVLLAALVYGYAVAFFTEFRTDALRYRLERVFGIVPAVPALPSNPLADHPSPALAEAGSKTPSTSL